MLIGPSTNSSNLHSLFIDTAGRHIRPCPKMHDIMTTQGPLWEVGMMHHTIQLSHIPEAAHGGITKYVCTPPHIYLC